MILQLHGEFETDNPGDFVEALKHCNCSGLTIANIKEKDDSIEFDVELDRQACGYRPAQALLADRINSFAEGYIIPQEIILTDKPQIESGTLHSDVEKPEAESVPELEPEESIEEE